MPLKVADYDKEQGIKQYTLSNSTGDLVVKIIDYGAIITNILVKDKNGVQRDVVLGWDDLDGYLGKRGEDPYFGASIGRCANRITNGKFTLNGKTYQLPLNDGQNSLHGGIKGFDKRKWNIITETENSITLELTSEDGEEGYPGKLRVELTYSVTETNELRLEYSAKLTENQTIDTIVNLTNHSYFNLNGCSDEQNMDVLKHEVKMKCQNYLQVNDVLQMTGKVLSVKTDSPVMDFFTKSHTIGERISEVKPNGYDHCYVIEDNEHNFNIKGNDSIREAVVVVTSPSTGITLTMSTTEPSVQFYSGNFLNGKQKTKKDQSAKELLIPKHGAFCVEAQRFPNAINEEKWRKQVVLKPNETYKQTTVYKLSAK